MSEGVSRLRQPRTKLKDRILPDYTKGEEIFNMVSHIVGGALGIAALVLCVVKSAMKGDPWGVTSSAIYGSSLIVLYTMSSVYHGLHRNMGKKVMQDIDHCTIYYLIGGTYTLILLSGVRRTHPGWAWTMFAVSCAAQIGVAPLIAYYFGRFSNYFLLTNLFVVPAATLILYISLVVLLLPAFAYLLIYIVNSLNLLLLWIASLPGASIEELHLTILQVSMIYVIIGAVYLLLTRKTSLKGGWSASSKEW